MMRERICGAMIALLLVGGTFGVIIKSHPKKSATVTHANSALPSVYPKPKSAGASPAAKTIQDPVIVAVGDIACSETEAMSNNSGICQDQATAKIAAAQHPKAVLVLGDQQYESGTSQDFAHEYEVSWGRFKSITYPVAGNHEYSSGGNGYYSYFGARAGEPNRGYYSFNIGTWHFVALNSNCGVVACSIGSSQEQWLKSDLATHHNGCTLAFWHHPRFSSGKLHGNDAAVGAFWQDLVSAGADVVLNGHEHNYERFAPQTATGVISSQGVREFVAGTGGRNLYPFRTTPQANSQFRQNRTYGVLALTLHAKSFNWRYIAIDGSVLDSGTSQCHSK